MATVNVKSRYPSGVLGVYWDKAIRKWKVMAPIDSTYLGAYYTVKEAVAAQDAYRRTGVRSEHIKERKGTPRPHKKPKTFSTGGIASCLSLK